MPAKQLTPFSILAWSTALCFSFFLLQSLVVYSIGLSGFWTNHVYLLTWAAASGAIAYPLNSRQRPSNFDLVIVQIAACLCMVAHTLISRAFGIHAESLFSWLALSGNALALFYVGLACLFIGTEGLTFKRRP